MDCMRVQCVLPNCLQKETLRHTILIHFKGVLPICILKSTNILAFFKVTIFKSFFFIKINLIKQKRLDCRNVITFAVRLVAFAFVIYLHLEMFNKIIILRVKLLKVA